MPLRDAMYQKLLRHQRLWWVAALSAMVHRRQQHFSSLTLATPPTSSSALHHRCSTVNYNANPHTKSWKTSCEDDKSSKVSNKSMTARSSKKLTDSHYGTEPASFLRGNRDNIEARVAFSEVLENSSVRSHSTVSGVDSSCKKAEDIVMCAVDVRELE